MAQNNDLQLMVIFKLGVTEFILPVYMVLTVEYPQKVVFFKNEDTSPNAIIIGFVFVDGVPIPILNMHELTGTVRGHADANDKLLIVRVEGHQFGFIADQASEGIYTKIQEPDTDYVAPIASNFIKGLGCRSNECLLILPDLTEIIDLESIKDVFADKSQ